MKANNLIRMARIASRSARQYHVKAFVLAGAISFDVMTEKLTPEGEYLGMAWIKSSNADVWASPAKAARKIRGDMKRLWAA